MKTLLIIFQVIVSLGLIATVLMQSGKSAGLGSIAGGAEQFFGKKKGLDDVLGKATIVLAALFLLITLTTSLI
ncbi:preprotein translocase subunit SecG [Desulfitispora alkaliphila]|uniref:preprotein translocase subunit SecG n=1 Tax=Desulfitispora alkaliphila TaxID=622674 RepID=UPI003D1E0066